MNHNSQFRRIPLVENVPGKIAMLTFHITEPNALFPENGVVGVQAFRCSGSRGDRHSKIEGECHLISAYSI